MGFVDVAAEVFSSLLLFGLVFGMSATVDVRDIVRQLHNWRALCIGVSLQFVILPFVGFLVVKAFQLDSVVGVTLLVITSSPGGSYSNWWCSMFNAELALSVTMTALSTLISTVMLPLNLVIYTRFSYSRDVVQSLDWTALFVSLLTVITGISCGMMASTLAHRRGAHAAHVFHKRANQMGNVAGLALITLSFAVSSSNQDSAIWDQSANFYIGVAMPALIGLTLAVSMATRFDLPKPERVAVAIESCYQNTGIATSVALTMFTNAQDLATAIGVPLYYGIIEACMLGLFCIVAWKVGWTKAPPDEWICVILANTYETQDEGDEHGADPAIEVVSGQADGDGETAQKAEATSSSSVDAVFEQTADGARVVANGPLESRKEANPVWLESGKAADASLEPRKNSDESTENGDGLSVGDGNQRAAGLHKTTGETEINTELADDSENGTRARLERTIAILRARATGYRNPARKGSFAEQAETEQEQPIETITKEEVHAAFDHFPERGQTQIPATPLESADVEESSSSYGSSSDPKPTSSAPTGGRRIIPEEDELI